MRITTHALMGLLGGPWFLAGSLLPDLLNPKMAYDYNPAKAPTWYMITHSFLYATPLYLVNPMLGLGYHLHLLVDTFTHEKEYRTYWAYPHGKLFQNKDFFEWSDKQLFNNGVDLGLLVINIMRWML